jgi:hypothetical protein
MIKNFWLRNKYYFDDQIVAEAGKTPPLLLKILT